MCHPPTGSPASPPKPVAPGKPAKLAVPVRNDGNVAVKATATYTLLVSTDGTDAGGVFQTTDAGAVSLKPAPASRRR